MYLSEALRRELQEEALESAPREVCGFVLRNGTTWAMDNINKNDGEWMMDLDDSIEFRSIHQGLIKGTYHSHPKGSIYPSVRDMAHCPTSYQMWIVTFAEVWRWKRHGESWVGVYEPTFGAAVVPGGTDGFRPASTSVALVGSGGCRGGFVSAQWVDEVGGGDQSLSDWIRQEAYS